MADKIRETFTIETSLQCGPTMPLKPAGGPEPHAIIPVDQAGPVSGSGIDGCRPYLNG